MELAVTLTFTLLETIAASFAKSANPDLSHTDQLLDSRTIPQGPMKTINIHDWVITKRIIWLFLCTAI